VRTRTKITKVVIPAAGFGTRMLPPTKAVPTRVFEEMQSYPQLNRS